MKNSKSVSGINPIPKSAIIKTPSRDELINFQAKRSCEKMSTLKSTQPI
jgi:hypothetical protein